MKLIEQIERINRLHELIKYRRTGTPEELATRLNLSTSMVYKLLDELRMRDVPIEYSRQMGSYYYREEYMMKILIEFHKIEYKE